MYQKHAKQSYMYDNPSRNHCLFLHLFGPWKMFKNGTKWGTNVSLACVVVGAMVDAMAVVPAMVVDVIA